MILLKEKVKLLGVRPELVFCMLLINQIFLMFNQNMIITSILDGKHSDGSLHPDGFAWDIRTNSIDPNIINKIIARAKELFEEQLDIVLESNHIHVEFDPKIIEMVELKKKVKEQED